MVYIDEVHYEMNNWGEEVIAKMKCTNDLYERAREECTKEQMIQFINEHPGRAKTKYFYCGTWHEGEYVRVVDNKYLRTDANNIKQDNLENLPKY